MKLSCSAKKKQPPPDPSPEAGRGRPRGRPRGRSCGRPRGRCRGRPRGRPRGGPRGTGRQTLQNLPNPQLPSKPSKPSKTLQTPSPTGTPGQGHFSIRPPRAKATAMAFYWLSKLPFASPQTLQTLQNPPNTPNTIQNPPNPPGLEACFEQVAQGLWLVRREFVDAAKPYRSQGGSNSRP